MAITDTNTDRSTFTLEEALANVPFYQRWRVHDPGPSTPLAERMAALPVLTKRDLRAYVPRGFIHKKCGYKEGFTSGEVEMVSTSGTTEERVSIVWNQAWWDRSEREAARLHPALERIYSGAHKEAVLTSPLCGNNLCHVGEAPMQERVMGNILFLNQTLDPTSWDASSLGSMAAELNLFKPAVLEADPAYLSILSRACLLAGHPLYQPECITLSYEFPSRMHYRQIHRAFPGVPVVSSYGSTETGHVFTQCQYGTFHQNMATCHVDIQPQLAEFGNPSVGRILVTTLDNPWSVLVRFDVGDVARVWRGDSCPCGNSEGIVIESIEGRTRDITFDPAGRVVTVKWLDDALELADGLIGYQLEQTGPRNYVMRYAAEPELELHTARILPGILHNVYGKDTLIEIRHDSALPPEQSGKFRLARTSWTAHPESIFDD